MELSSLGGFLGFLGACFAAAASGAVFTPGPWYDALARPRWCPPNWLFAPAWAVLFLMIAIAGWLIWEAVGFSGGALALSLYALQLVLNAAWSGIFFGMRRMDLAFAELCLLWLSILACIIVFWLIRRGVDANHTPISQTDQWSTRVAAVDSGICLDHLVGIKPRQP